MLWYWNKALIVTVKFNHKSIAQSCEQDPWGKNGKTTSVDLLFHPLSHRATQMLHEGLIGVRIPLIGLREYQCHFQGRSTLSAVARNSNKLAFYSIFLPSSPSQTPSYWRCLARSRLLMNQRDSASETSECNAGAINLINRPFKTLKQKAVRLNKIVLDLRMPTKPIIRDGFFFRRLISVVGAA